MESLSWRVAKVRNTFAYNKKVPESFSLAKVIKKQLWENQETVFLLHWDVYGKGRNNEAKAERVIMQK